jgi:hypothetical protein
MNMRPLLAATLVLGLSAGLFAGSTPSEEGCPHPPRKEWRDDSNRPTPTPEVAAFLEARHSLHDSLGQAMRAYAEAVREGAAPRSLTTERQRIADLAALLERHRLDNLDLWLDVAAYHPGPEGRPFRKGMKHRRKASQAPSTDSTATP